MKILFAASEAFPFCKTGGLADVAGSLPVSLAENGDQVAVILPLYDKIPYEWRQRMVYRSYIYVDVAWRHQYCGLFVMEYRGVTWYFVDNEHYFRRGRLYGEYDDGERFAFFSKAVVDLLPSLDWVPDVIHCNDWQTALVPIYYRLFYANNDWYSGIKTLFTIHNIQYQGQYGFEILEDVFGIPKSEQSLLEYNDCVNLMKGAIESANWVSTVSPTYAKEILDPWFAHKLDPILRERAWKLSGILNGIDVVGYDPATDKNLYETYDAKHLEGKAVNKAKLQERLGLAVDPDVPLIGMVTRLVSHKGLDLVKGGVDNIMTYSNAQFVVLGSGDWEYEQFFKEMQAKYPGRFVLCQGFVPELARKIYGGSDIFLMPSKSEPCGLSQMVALRYGSIPVVRETGGLKDSITDSGDGKGNGFTFQTYDTQDMLNSVHRAIYAYNESKDGWKVLVERAMACDNSWGRSANDYIRLYKQLINS